MNLVYYKAENGGNIGDELNPWLWKRLIPGFEALYPDVDFLGIGSILSHGYLHKGKEKILFGCGVRAYIPCPDCVRKDLSFVRGPISGKFTGLPYICDSAYALALTDEYRNWQTAQKCYNVAYIPYYMHDSVYYKLLANITGYHVISPHLPVEKFLSELSKCRYVIAAAMHGAILADILRIPWVGVRFPTMGCETNLTSELKWADWQIGMDIDDNVIPCKLYDPLRIPTRIGRTTAVATWLRKLRTFQEFRMSNQRLFDDKVAQIKEAIERLVAHMNTK